MVKVDVKWPKEFVLHYKWPHYIILYPNMYYGDSIHYIISIRNLGIADLYTNIKSDGINVFQQ